MYVVTATISVSFADKLAEAYAWAGLGYVSAPVFGRPDVAEAGKLNIMPVSFPEALDRVQPLFEVIGQPVFVMGDQPRHAKVLKVAGNMMIAMAIEALAEGVAPAPDQGIKPQAFVDPMLQTPWTQGARS